MSARDHDADAEDDADPTAPVPDDLAEDDAGAEMRERVAKVATVAAGLALLVERRVEEREALIERARRLLVL